MKITLLNIDDVDIAVLLYSLFEGRLICQTDYNFFFCCCYENI